MASSFFPPQVNVKYYSLVYLHPDKYDKTCNKVKVEAEYL